MRSQGKQITNLTLLTEYKGKNQPMAGFATDKQLDISVKPRFKKIQI